MKKKILYVEDDVSLSFLTTDNLEQSGYEVHHCVSGNEALRSFADNIFDICILDIMLPEMDGFTIAKHIRNQNLDIPILFLSAKTLKEDRIKGLKLGADDYILKPFSIEELILKIEVFLARSKKMYVGQNEAEVKFGGFLFDLNACTIIYNDMVINLTFREASLLNLLVKNKNQIVSREQILISIWGENDYFMGRSMDVFIYRLRKKLLADKMISIENVHGVGFKLIELKL